MSARGEDDDPKGDGEPVDALVVGAGAAGLCAGIFAARAGARTLLLETRRSPGAKIRVSGGGRSNVLPTRVELGNFHTSGSPRTLRNILFSWPLAEVRSFFERDLGLPLVVEADTGKLFPASQDARDVVRVLLAACARAGAEIRGGCRVVELRPPVEESGLFAARLESGVVLHARRVVLTTGGLSLPRTGSDGGGLRIARELGHEIVPTRPALVPLTTRATAWTELSGIALPILLRAVVESRTLEERRGNLLFTHRGFSGPVVLDLSRHVTRATESDTDGSDTPGPTGVGATELRAQWTELDATDWTSRLASAGGREVRTVVAELLPRRLAALLVELAELPPERRASELRRDERACLLEALTACRLPIDGDEGYAKAEVTAGGVALAEVQPKTLESRRVPGLHFAGEILDVVGHIGGYNFLWAWVSGRRAGEGAAG